MSAKTVIIGGPGAQGAKVRLSDSHGDSIEIGRARVRLKLGALAFATSQHGISTTEDLATAGLEVLCETAIRYFEALTGARIRRGVNGDETRLRLAAMSYAACRHGVDATIEIARAGMGILCEAAIRYCEEISGRRPGTVADPMIEE